MYVIGLCLSPQLGQTFEYIVHAYQAGLIKRKAKSPRAELIDCLFKLIDCLINGKKVYCFLFKAAGT